MRFARLTAEPGFETSRLGVLARSRGGGATKAGSLERAGSRATLAREGVELARALVASFAARTGRRLGDRRVVGACFVAVAAG